MSNSNKDFAVVPGIDGLAGNILANRSEEDRQFEVGQATTDWFRRYNQNFIYVIVNHIPSGRESALFRHSHTRHIDDDINSFYYVNYQTSVRLDFAYNNIPPQILSTDTSGLTTGYSSISFTDASGNLLSNQEDWTSGGTSAVYQVITGDNQVRIETTPTTSLRAEHDDAWAFVHSGWPSSPGMSRAGLLLQFRRC